MPRKKRGFGEHPCLIAGDLDKKLAEELRSNRESGQPMIDEEEFPSGKLRVTVIWDEWHRMPLEDRTAIILLAYERAEGSEYHGRIALASGLTVPEAHAAGMLPFQVFAALRKDDPVTPEQCREAMISEGASILLDPQKPQLRFATVEDAEGSVKRLADRLPGSEPIWVITQDVGRVEDWAQV